MKLDQHNRIPSVKVFWNDQDITDICMEVDDEAGYAIIGVLSQRSSRLFPMWLLDYEKHDAFKVKLDGAIRIEVPTQDPAVNGAHPV